jgi:enoyl-CoA hydratase/carnithine racemase
LGLVNHVCDDFERATEKAVEIATKIGDKGPIAIRAAKQAISRGMETDLQAGL